MSVRASDHLCMSGREKEFELAHSNGPCSSRGLTYSYTNKMSSHATQLYRPKRVFAEEARDELTTLAEWAVGRARLCHGRWRNWLFQLRRGRRCHGSRTGADGGCGMLGKFFLRENKRKKIISEVERKEERPKYKYLLLEYTKEEKTNKVCQPNSQNGQSSKRKRYPPKRNHSCEYEYEQICKHDVTVKTGVAETWMIEKHGHSSSRHRRTRL